MCLYSQPCVHADKWAMAIFDTQHITVGKSTIPNLVQTIHYNNSITIFFYSFILFGNTLGARPLAHDGSNDAETRMDVPFGDKKVTN